MPSVVTIAGILLTNEVEVRGVLDAEPEIGAEAEHTDAPSADRENGRPLELAG